MVSLGTMDKEQFVKSLRNQSGTILTKQRKQTHEYPY